nr:MAG TPA: hypothetical protein [Caudoviricetes sp.]
MKIKVFEMEFDASNLQEVAFVKEVITGSNLSVKTETVAIVQEKEEKPVEAKETTLGSDPRMPVKPERKKAAAKLDEQKPIEEPAPVVEEQKPVETVTDKTAEPTAKEMQDLVIGLVKSGELSREDVQNIFQEFGGTSLMKIASSKFALLKQRLTTYKN